MQCSSEYAFWRCIIVYRTDFRWSYHPFSMQTKRSFIPLGDHLVPVLVVAHSLRPSQRRAAANCKTQAPSRPCDIIFSQTPCSKASSGAEARQTYMKLADVCSVCWEVLYATRLRHVHCPCLSLTARWRIRRSGKLIDTLDKTLRPSSRAKALSGGSMPASLTVSLAS